MTNSFNTSAVKKGLLITVQFENGKKRSGIVTNVTNNDIQYRYFDEGVEMIQASVITREQVEEGALSFIVSEHVGQGASTKAEAKSEKTSFFVKLGQVRNIDKLIRVFKNEDPQTLALIASFLNPKTRVEFLYRLPDDVFEKVDNALKNVSNINQEILAQLEAKLEDKFNRFKENASQKRNDPQFDPFGGLLGGLLGGKGPEDLFKNFNPNDIKNIFGEGMKPENQPPLPNPEQMRELFENLPNMLNDLLGGLNNQDDEDDDDQRGRRR